jgi:hypothetical protein
VSFYQLIQAWLYKSNNRNRERKWKWDWKLVYGISLNFHWEDKVTFHTALVISNLLTLLLNRIFGLEDGLYLLDNSESCWKSLLSLVRIIDCL